MIMLQEIIFNNDFFEEIDDDKFVKLTLLEMLFKQVNDDVMLMDNYIKTNDIKSWRLQIHRLGGSCANLGATKLASLCKTIEKSEELNIDTQQKLISEYATELKQYISKMITDLKKTISE
jgi:HPt (histidine-containing phosphotransfer) domain-containing protein